MTTRLMRLLLALAFAFPTAACAEPAISALVPDAAADAGVDSRVADAGITLMCEGAPETCRATHVSDVVFPACCDEENAFRCGADMSSFTDDLPFDGCLAKHQPGDGSKNCAEFLDDLDGTPDGVFSLYLSPVLGRVDVPSCCTPTGECGAVVDTINLGLFEAALGLGCVPLRRLTRLGADGTADGGAEDAGQAQRARPFPYCLPGGDDVGDDSACPPVMTIALTGLNLCDALVRLGLPLIGCESTASTPLWVCQAINEPTIDTRQVPTDVGDCLQFVPDLVRGCGEGLSNRGDGMRCIPNVDATKLGCIDTFEHPDLLAELIAEMPDILCGCGEAVQGNGFCIPRTKRETCGGRDLEAPENASIKTTLLAQIPEFVCGCGAVQTSTESCLRNTASDVCGTIEVTAGPIPNVPNRMCGCGDGTLGDGTCLNNVPRDLCGAVPECTPLGEQGTCADGQTCRDTLPAGAPDGLADACAPA